MTWFRAIVLLSIVLVLGAASASDANAQSAVVEGVARAADGDAPIPFALVRLVPADTTASTSGTPSQGITSADGRYRFVGVAAGQYRVQLLRIGFRPVLSDPVVVANRETVQLPLRVVAQPLELPPVTVTPETCVEARALPQHPQLQTVWQQARDGASIREGLMTRYRYSILTREVGFEHTPTGPTPPATLDQRAISDPKTALQLAARRRADRLSRGYFGSNDGWYPPNDLDVLHEDFLKAHCFHPSIERGEGEIGLRFRPLKVRSNFVDIRGTIWLDSATYLARRIDLEYMNGDESRGTVRIDFDDLAIADGTLRMRIGLEYALRPSLRKPDRRTEGKVAFTYSNFEEVPPR